MFIPSNFLLAVGKSIVKALVKYGGNAVGFGIAGDLIMEYGVPIAQDLWTPGANTGTMPNGTRKLRLSPRQRRKMSSKMWPKSSRKSLLVNRKNFSKCSAPI